MGHGTRSRTRPAARFIAILFSLLAIAPAAPAADAPTLLAHGSSDTYWYAVVKKEGDAWVTQVWMRLLDNHPSRQSSGWQPLQEIPGRTVHLADYRGELLMILEDGQWKRLSPTQFVSGPPLAHGPILAMAGGGEALWAISLGIPPPGGLPSTRSSTQPATTRLAATTRSTSPTTIRILPQLYQLSGGGWVWRGELPVSFRQDNPQLMSLAVVGGELLLASTDESGRVSIHRYDSTASRWSETATVSPGIKPVEVKLMAMRDRAVLWARPAQGPGVLIFRPQPSSWSNPKPIEFAAAPQFVAFSVTAAGDEVRVLGLQAGDKLVEQKYGPGGDVTQPLTAAGSSKVPSDRPGFMQVLVLLALGSFVLTNLSRRKPTQVIEINKVRIALAPLGPRLVAGIIDAIPVFVGAAWAVRYVPTASKWQELLSGGTARWIVLGSWAAYVLHTLLAELIWSRSIGKMFLGLRVVGFDGQKPPARAIVIRNVLRLLDVVLSGFPLTAVFFSPLRQRLAEIPAGTLVAVKLPKEAERVKETEG